MRNIAVLAVLVIIVLLFSAFNPIYCQEQSERNYGFSLGGMFGIVHGQAREYVYPVTNTTHKYLSELLWDMKPVFYLGIQADFGRRNLMSAPGFFASVSFKAGIPGDTGVMEDRDWQSKTSDVLTDYSRHTNTTREYFWLDAAIGASIPIGSVTYIKPFLSFSWTHFAFSGRDGHGEYSYWGTPYISYEGQKVIDYQQDWILIAAGFSIGTNTRPFSISLSFQISPFIYCTSRDEHFSVYLDIYDKWSTNTIYMDLTSSGLFIKPGINISYIWKNISFSGEFTLHSIGRTTGEAYINQDNAGFSLSPNKSGAGLFLLDFSFIVKILI
jgi:outer membrane protease